MTKEEKLEQLDELVLNKMISIVTSGDLEELPLLATATNYLKANQQVSEKKKETSNDRHKEMVAKAKKERMNGHSK